MEIDRRRSRDDMTEVVIVATAGVNVGRPCGPQRPLLRCSTSFFTGDSLPLNNSSYLSLTSTSASTGPPRKTTGVADRYTTVCLFISYLCPLISMTSLFACLFDCYITFADQDPSLCYNPGVKRRAQQSLSLRPTKVFQLKYLTWPLLDTS